MANSKRKKNEQPQLIDPATLAWWTITIRTASGWSQETLAELSKLSVRTIQRVEDEQPSSIDTRRALALGLGYDNVDFFQDPEHIQKLYELRSDMVNTYQEGIKKLHPDTDFIDAVEAKSGKDLADFAECINAWSSDFDDDAPDEAERLFCLLADYLQDYGDADDLYSQTARLDVHAELGEILADLNQEGYGFYYATRRMQMTGDNWEDKTPLKFTLGYMRLLPKGIAPAKFAVPKKGSFR